MDQQETQKRDWWRVGDGAVLAAYAGIVLWTIRYHEKWADEAQAWLIARDLDLRTIWFHESRYEGSPGLWHTILWVAQHVFRAKYDALSYIGAVFAIAGAAILLFRAPFPRTVRWPLAFTYVMVYQYAVISRPYTLLPLLAFSAAVFFKDVQRPERLTLILVLLATLTIHGTILAVCLGFAFLVEARKVWASLGATIRGKYWVCLGAMTCTFVFLFIILKPTPDVEEFVLKEQFSHAPAAFKATIPTFWDKLTSITSGAFLDWLVPSVILLVLLAGWTIWRRKWITFILPVGLLIIFYGAIHGAAHHHGIVFIAAITGLWIAWPGNEERRTFGGHQHLGLMAVNALLLILSALNIWDAAVVIKREYLYPYSGARDAAQYLKAVGADRGPMFGLLFGVVGVQAYFDHNIFVNNPTTYFHHGLPLDVTMLNVDMLYQVKPEYVVTYSMDPELMLQTGAGELTSRGYELVHFSDGYYLYKRSIFERETYFIFRRTPEFSSNAALSSGNPHNP